MTEEIKLPPSATNLPRCPFLGILKDQNVFVNSPSRTNFCHKSEPGVFPSYTLQKKICLSTVFSQCPVFSKYAKSRIPDELRWKSPLSLEGGLLGWVTIPFLALGFALLVVIVGIQNSWWQAAAAAGMTPPTRMPLQATLAGTVAPTGRLVVLPVENSPRTTLAVDALELTPTPTELSFFQRLFLPPATGTPTQSGNPPPPWSLTPTFTPTRTSTGTATPTPTSRPTPTLTPTFTLWPTESSTILPVPSDTLVPTPANTLEDTNTPKPTPTLKPTPTHKPTNTPRPTHPPEDTPDDDFPTPTDDD